MSGLIGANGRIVSGRMLRVTFMFELPADFPEIEVNNFLDGHVSLSLLAGRWCRQVRSDVLKLTPGAPPSIP